MNALWTRTWRLPLLTTAALLFVASVAAAARVDFVGEPPVDVDPDKGAFEGRPHGVMPPGQAERTPPGARPHDQARRFGGRGRQPNLWKRLSVAEQDAVEAFIEEHFPDLFDELAELDRRRPKMFEQRMRGVAPQMLELMELAQRDPERAELAIRERTLDMKLRLLMRRNRQAEQDANREELQTRLRAIIGELFDCRLERREMEIRDIEDRLSVLNARLLKDRVNRAELIDEFVEDHLKFGPRRRRPPDDRDRPRDRPLDRPLWDGP